ncbi:MAG: hypothetical protein CSA72_08710 [Rhodobacterales bacterium]|nr:MAG: hypothetical protein CSA72_08710 [Rhodobacterales bacterium]
MVKSVLGGILTGGFVSVIGLSTLSVMSEQPAGAVPPMVPQVQSPVTGAPQPTEFAPLIAAPDGDDAAPQPEATPTVPAPSEAATPPALEIDTGAVPQTGLEQDSPAPMMADTPPASGDATDAPNPPSTAPAAPTAPEPSPRPAADTAAALAPAAEPTMTDPAPVSPDLPADRPERDSQVLESPLSQAPVVPLPEQDIAISTDPAQPEASDTPQDSFIRIAPPVSMEPSDEAPAEKPSTFAPVAPLKSDAGSLFDTAPEEATPETLPALEAYAAQAPAPDGRPLLSVILIDDARIGLGPDAVSALPMQVSVALEASGSNARARMDAYRAAGVETLALADLPESGTAGDQQIALEALFSALPEAIALLDPGELGLGNNRVAISETITRLQDDGRGLVALSSGLGGALRAAEKDGVPAAAIYRDLDREGQDAQVIRRFLDQAAFRARNEGQVVLLARLRPDTLSALDLWSNAERAQGVSLVPVSVQLLGQERGPQ